MIKIVCVVFICLIALFVIVITLLLHCLEGMMLKYVKDKNRKTRHVINIVQKSATNYCIMKLILKAGLADFVQTFNTET